MHPEFSTNGSIRFEQPALADCSGWQSIPVLYFPQAGVSESIQRDWFTDDRYGHCDCAFRLGCQGMRAKSRMEDFGRNTTLWRVRICNFSIFTWINLNFHVDYPGSPFYLFPAISGNRPGLRFHCYCLYPHPVRLGSRGDCRTYHTKQAVLTLLYRYLNLILQN